MRRWFTSVAGMIAVMAVLWGNGRISKAESPKLFLGLYNTAADEGAFGSYQPGVGTDLEILKEQFPQYSCIKLSLDGKILGLNGTQLDEINPVTGATALWRDLKLYCGMQLDLTSFTVADFGIFAHEYATYYSEPKHILHGFLYGSNGIEYYSADIYEKVGEDENGEDEYDLCKRLYGIEWVDDNLYGISDTDILQFDLSPFFYGAVIVEPKYSTSRLWNLCYGADGLLYGSDPVNGIYSINPGTGETVFIHNFVSGNSHETWCVAPNLFTLAGIHPNRCSNYGYSYPFTCQGTGFLEGTTIKLSKQGQQDIIGRNVTVCANNNMLSCYFDCLNIALGYWDVVVMSADGRIKTLPNGFEIYLDTPYNLRVHQSGADRNCSVSWNSVKEADEYYVECSEDEQFGTVLSQSGWITDTSYTFTDLELNHTYYFRVKARTLPRQCLWTQTSQEEFILDQLIGTDCQSSSGNVVLAGIAGVGYIESGSVVSPTIAFYSGGAWETLEFTKSDGEETSLTVDIYDAESGTLLKENVLSGSDISDLTINKIVLKANMATTNSNSTPSLSDWSIGYHEQFESPFSQVYSSGSLSIMVSLRVHVETIGWPEVIENLPVTINFINPSWFPMPGPPIYLDYYGNYDFGSMMSGIYEVHVCAPGYHEWVRTMNLMEPSTLQVVLYHAHNGDVNADGKVDSLDEEVINANMGLEGAYWDMGDINWDYIVNEDDLKMWTSNNGYASYTLTATVELEDFSNNLNRLSQYPLSIELRDPDTHQVIKVDNLLVLTENPGTIVIPKVEPGTYEMCVKTSHFIPAIKTTIFVNDTTVITEPFLLANGEVNGDGQVNSLDIDALAVAIRRNYTELLLYDLNGDGVINMTDKDHLIHTILNTEYGDVNLDHCVDVGDLGILAANYGSSNKTWA
jgi:hypothetical protein